MKSYTIYPIFSVKRKDRDSNKDKVWGIEQKLETTDVYACKIMTLYPYGQCSVHLHRNKRESFVLLEGELILDTINTDTCEHTITHLKNKYDNVTIEPMVPHSFYCPKGQNGNTVFMEVSTPDSPSDSYRFEPSKVTN